MMFKVLQKWHGAGNDFLVDIQEQGVDVWWNAQRVQAACDRHAGVGADGVLVATLGSQIAMTLFNADGSVAEMSGNGIRCLVGAVARATHRTDEVMDVLTDAGLRHVRWRVAGTQMRGSVSMGPVSTAPGPEGTLGLARVGNPHVVVMDDASWSDHDREVLADQWATAVGGANVEFVVLRDVDHVSLRVIERGVGWTQACGTGSCAVATILRERGLVGEMVRVDNPGGTLHVRWDDDGAVLEGPMTFVANVEWYAE